MVDLQAVSFGVPFVWFVYFVVQTTFRPSDFTAGLGLDFHRLGEDQAGEFADAAPAFDDAQEVGCALAFAAETGAGDVQVIGAEFLLLHPAAVVGDNDGGVGEDSGQSDLDLGGFGVPRVINELA